MRDLNRPQPIHPDDCACPRCDPQLLGGRQRATHEIALTGLIVAASLVCAALAILGLN
ncbi:MAG: hypothetical protein H2049_00490 [Porphyrobacter sp.]|nr:hypothetical protein [Porphyrobacter sp.]